MRMKFWLLQCRDELVAGAGMAAVFQIIVVLQGEGFRWETLYFFPVYLLLGTMFIMMISLATNYKLTLSLVLSMGATRRECFWGLQMLKLLPGAVCFAIAFLVCRFLIPGGADLVPLLCLIACGVVVFSSVGDLVGLASYRWGKLGAVLLVGFLAVFGGIIGATAATGLNAGNAFLRKLAVGANPYLLIAAVTAAVLLAVDVALERPVLRRYEVKL